VTPELRHLRAFLAVAEAGSFTAAARELYLSQQALSRVVRRMEDELGVELFARGSRAVRLTSAGEAMLATARQATTAADAAFDAARRADGLGPRALRVDISSSGIETGAAVLRRLRRVHPEIAVHQTEGGVARGLSALRAGALDVLLGLAARVPEDLRAEELRRERVLLGIAAGHPLAAGDEIPLAALAGLPLLLPDEADAGEWVAFVEAALASAGVTPTRWPGTTYGSTAAAEVVREGLCVVPTTAWAEPPAGVAFRPLTDPPLVFPWSVLWRPGAEKRPELAAFLACARAERDAAGWLDAGQSATPSAR
jgi:DNA-binding transcriptional LysR family regulator